MKPGESGKVKAQEYAAKLESWLKEQTSLPGHGGKPNKAEIAKLAGIGDRKRFYDNPRCIELLNDCKLPVVNCEVSDAEKTKLENRIRELETRVDKEMAENFELKRKLRKLQHIEEIMESGARFVR